jgi:CPA2 family monovalent cation:H+ antiporter-2
MADCVSILLAAGGAPGTWSIFLDVIILLAAAVILGGLAERLGQSAIVGYLFAGAIVGPKALGWISTEDELFSISELGVALLLFAIGLEFSPRRLLALGPVVLKLGLLQVLLTLAIAFGAALLFALDARESSVIGMMVAISSTACVLRMLNDRAELDSQHGRRALGVLLIQDGAVIPMMLLVSVMAAGGTTTDILNRLAIAFGLAICMFGGFLVFFKYIAPRLLHTRSFHRNRDLPVLLAIIMAIGSAWITHALGLSPALGAFAAGMILAISPFAPQIRSDTKSLTTVMVTLFFAAIGMFADPAWFAGNWLLVIGVALAIVLGKAIIIIVIARLLRRPWRIAIAIGLCLAQAGEFSFVLASIARGDGGDDALMSPFVFSAMISATIITLLITPWLVGYAARTGTWIERLIRPKSAGAAASFDETADPPPIDKMLIIGFGPAGQRVAEGLTEDHREDLTVIDLNPENVETARQYGLDATLGDCTQRTILEHASIHRAKIVVITIPDHAIAQQVIRIIRAIAPQARLIVRCRYHIMHGALVLAGAHHVVNEEDEIGRQLAESTRELLRE